MEGLAVVEGVEEGEEEEEAVATESGRVSGVEEVDEERGGVEAEKEEEVVESGCSRHKGLSSCAAFSHGQPRLAVVGNVKKESEGGEGEGGDCGARRPTAEPPRWTRRERWLGCCKELSLTAAAAAVAADAAFAVAAYAVADAPSVGVYSARRPETFVARHGAPLRAHARRPRELARGKTAENAVQRAVVQGEGGGGGGGGSGGRRRGGSGGGNGGERRGPANAGVLDLRASHLTLHTLSRIKESFRRIKE
ncbi:unnamed protein product [Closterium sp. NIES-54]